MASVTPTAAACGAPLEEEDLARASVYSLLARVLRAPPDAESVAHLTSLELPRDDDDGMVGAWNAMADVARALDEPAALQEFNDLFVGLGRGEVVTHGSWYLTGFLMEEPLAKLRADLAELGIARNDDNKEPEDHIASLCEVMALLIAGSPPASWEVQQDFFGKHLKPWAETFFANLDEAESAVFYRGVAALGREFMRIENSAFEMQV